MLMVIVNSATSIMAGFVIFSTIGFMALETNSKVDEVVRKGRVLYC